MRPVNLIPESERRGAGQQGSPLAFIVVGALVALLLGVALVVTTNNEISSTKGEITELESDIATTEAKAAKLAAYSQLGEVRDQRVSTVTSLADSRFDWERVMRELALVLPDDVWLTNLTGTVKPEVAVNGASGVALRTSVPGPALEMIGCAAGQESVARFVSSLKDIDGVTRVAVEYSKVGGEGGASSGPEETSDSASATTSDCSGPSIAQFQIVAAFDAAPVPTTGTESGE